MILLALYVAGVIAVIAMLGGYEYSTHRRAVQECAQNGHNWVPASLGDHPDARLICAHCFKEIR